VKGCWQIDRVREDKGESMQPIQLIIEDGGSPDRQLLEIDEPIEGEILSVYICSGLLPIVRVRIFGRLFDMKYYMPCPVTN
jgi:hypothetical protein